jgi:hypothetical protein
VKKNEKNPNHDLLVAGGRDFLKASASIAKFGDEIVGAAQRVLKRRANELSQAAGLPLNTNKITTSPKEGYISSGMDGTGATIGLYAPLGKQFFNLYVWWGISEEHREQELCGAYASVGCSTVAGADALFKAVRNRSKGAFTSSEGYYVQNQKSLRPEDFVNLESHFEALMMQWIACCKAIGGLKKHLKS